MLDTYRKDDGLIVVSQVNAERALRVIAMNLMAEKWLGYAREESRGMAFRRLLPEKIAQMVDEYVDYEEDGNDLAAVLGRVRHFAVRARNGKEMPFRLRVVRADSLDHTPWYNLVLVDETESRKREAFRKLLSENFKGHEVIDPLVELPDRNSLAQDIEIVRHYTNSEGLQATFAILEIDKFEDLLVHYGREQCHKILKHIGQQCRQKVRGDDVVGVLGEWRLGIILLDTTVETAPIAINRLRWVIGNFPPHFSSGEKMPVTVSIGHMQIHQHTSATLDLDICEAHFSLARRDQTNAVVHIPD